MVEAIIFPRRQEFDFRDKYLGCWKELLLSKGQKYLRI